MKHFRFFACLFLFTSSFSWLHAQEANTGNWWIYFGNQAINKRWNWWNEVQYRNYNFAGDLQQMLLRTGIGYNLTENNNNLLFGYAWIRSRNYVAAPSTLTNTFDENRLYLQLLTRQNFGRVILQHRYRAEYRLVEDRDPALRFRYFLSVIVPFNNQTLSKGTVYAQCYEELFINTKAPSFDRNRLYAAVGYVFHPSFRVELGLMAQTVQTSNRNQFQIVVFNNLPLTKPKKSD